jgi:hypothetical protein
MDASEPVFSLREVKVGAWSIGGYAALALIVIAFIGWSPLLPHNAGASGYTPNVAEAQPLSDPAPDLG